MLNALLATAHDLMVGLALASLAAALIAGLVRSNRALRGREQVRSRVRVERTGEPDWSFPPRPRPAATDFAADHRSRTRVGL